MSGSFDPQKTPPYQRPIEQTELMEELERQADFSDMNVEHLIKLYKRKYPGEALWMLTQDMNKQALIWYNVIETLKRGDTNERSQMKKRYEEELKLLPEQALSNPLWTFDVDKAFNRVRNYAKGMLKIARSHAMELLTELNVEPGTTTTVQVELGFPPSLTLGFEKTFTGAAVRAGNG